MKHLHSYEHTIGDAPTDIQIGDYVICIEKDDEKTLLNNFLKNNIGKYIRYNGYMSSFPYDVEYYNVPEYIIKDNFAEDGSRYFTREEILFFSPNKSDLEPYIQANKYNI
jgi:hypothetical protein